MPAAEKKAKKSRKTILNMDTNEIFDIFEASSQSQEQSASSSNAMSSESLFEIPFLVNRHVIPLTLASITSNAKSLIMGVDLRTGKAAAMLAGFQGENQHKMRITMAELNTILEGENFKKIENLLWQKGILPFDLGEIHVSLYVAKHGGKSIRFQRRGEGEEANFFFAPVTWRKIGEMKDYIKMVQEMLSQSQINIHHFVEQFVAECVLALKSDKITYNFLSKQTTAVQSELVRKCMAKTTPFLTNVYAQNLTLFDHTNFAFIREEFIIYHQGFFQEKIFAALKNV